MIVDPLPTQTYGGPISSLTSKIGHTASSLLSSVTATGSSLLSSATASASASLSSASSVASASISSASSVASASYSSASSAASSSYYATATSSVAPVPTVVPGNEAIYDKAGDAGQRTLWVVFVIMAIASAAFAFMSWRIPIAKRLYHIITTIIVMTAAISYFAMACGDGVSYHHTVITEQHKHVPDTTQDVYRQVYWARYVDWSITTPLLLLDLCLLAGLNGGHTLLAIVADIIMILTGLFAAFGTENNPSKWGYYAIACLAYLVIIWHLALHGRAQAMSKGGKVASLFASIAGFTLILWTAYPIVWGIADGARKVSVDAEIIAYAVLDVMAKVVFGAWLLISHQSIPEISADIGGYWSNGLGEGSIRVGDDEEGA